MELSESGRQYLTNYYLLEQTRTDAHQFLEDIAVRFSAAVKEHLKLKAGSSLVLDEVYVQNGGGYVGFMFSVPDVEGPQGQLTGWRYEIVYRDAMRTDSLDDTTTCRVLGWTKKANSRQINEAKRLATALGQADPYRETLVSLVSSPSDDVVDEIAELVVSYYDDYVRIAEAASDEVGGATS